MTWKPCYASGNEVALWFLSERAIRAQLQAVDKLEALSDEELLADVLDALKKVCV